MCAHAQLTARYTQAFCARAYQQIIPTVWRKLMFSCQMHCNCQWALSVRACVCACALATFFAFIRFLYFKGKQKLGYQTTGSIHLHYTYYNKKTLAYLHVAVRCFTRLAELQCLWFGKGLKKFCTHWCKHKYVYLHTCIHTLSCCMHVQLDNPT